MKVCVASTTQSLKRRSASIHHMVVHHQHGLSGREASGQPKRAWQELAVGQRQGLHDQRAGEAVAGLIRVFGLPLDIKGTWFVAGVKTADDRKTELRTGPGRLRSDCLPLRMPPDIRQMADFVGLRPAGLPWPIRTLFAGESAFLPEILELSDRPIPCLFRLRSGRAGHKPTASD